MPSKNLSQTVLSSSTFSGAPCIYLSRARGNGRNEDWRIEGGGRESKVGKNGEKGRERGTPCPTSNKLVIIFSQYLSWIGCYFIIFYCLLLLLLPVRKPPSVPAHPCTLRHPLTTLPSPLSSPFDRRQRPALFYYLEPLSAPREFTRGTHYWGVYSAVTVALATRLSPLLPSSSFISSFVFDRVNRVRRTQNAKFAGLSTRRLHSSNVYYILPFSRKLINI